MFRRRFRRSYKRRVFRRRRTFRKRRFRSRTNASYRTFKFNRGYPENDIDSPTTTTPSGSPGFTSGSFDFKFRYLNNYSEFVNMFDSFRVTGIQHKFFPVGMNTGMLGRGRFYYYHDHNDVVRPSSEKQILERADYKVRSMDTPTPFKIYYKPKVSVKLYAGASVEAFGTLIKQPWVDLNAFGIECPFFGLKWAWVDNDNTNIISMKCITTVYFKCRGVQ